MSRWIEALCCLMSCSLLLPGCPSLTLLCSREALHTVGKAVILAASSLSRKELQDEPF